MKQQRNAGEHPQQPGNMPTTEDMVRYLKRQRDDLLQQLDEMGQRQTAEITRAEKQRDELATALKECISLGEEGATLGLKLAESHSDLLSALRRRYGLCDCQNNGCTTCIEDRAIIANAAGEA